MNKIKYTLIINGEAEEVEARRPTGVWIRSVMADGSMTEPQYFELPTELPPEPRPPALLRLK